MTANLSGGLTVKSLQASPAGRGRRALHPAVVFILLLAGCTPSVPSSNPSPAAMPASPVTSAPASPGGSPIDTANWAVYKSKRYGFDIKYPPGWAVTPATHDWKLEKDVADWDAAGSEVFWAPVPLYVTVWSTPAGNMAATVDGVAAWVEQYCQLGNHSCTGLDQATPLCNGRDCDAGLLVTVDGQFYEAFFTGGQHEGHVVGVTVGRPESHETVARYGGARRLLESFLSGMNVCPARPDKTPPGCP